MSSKRRKAERLEACCQWALLTAKNHPTVYITLYRPTFILRSVYD